MPKVHIDNSRKAYHHNITTPQTRMETIIDCKYEIEYCLNEIPIGNTNHHNINMWYWFKYE